MFAYEVILSDYRQIFRCYLAHSEVNKLLLTSDIKNLIIFWSIKKQNKYKLFVCLKTCFALSAKLPFLEFFRTWWSWYLKYNLRNKKFKILFHYSYIWWFNWYYYKIFISISWNTSNCNCKMKNKFYFNWSRITERNRN